MFIINFVLNGVGLYLRMGLCSSGYGIHKLLSQTYSISGCETLKCADIRDINGNPYQCLPEREAISWPKRCLEHDEALCKFNSKLMKYSLSLHI